MKRLKKLTDIWTLLQQLRNAEQSYSRANSKWTLECYCRGNGERVKQTSISSDATPEGEVLREGGNCSLFVPLSENPHLI